MNVRSWIPVVVASAAMVVRAEVNLPEGYTQLQYIESTGTQYIDTGYLPLKDDKIECVLTAAPFDEKEPWHQVLRYYPMAFGWKNASPEYSMNFMVWHVNENRPGYSQGDQVFAPNSGVQFSVGEKMKIICDGKKATYSRIDGMKAGVLLAGSSKALTDATLSLYIFAQHQGTSAFQPSVMKLYSFKIRSADGTLVRDYVPCRDPNGKVGLYDVANDYATVSKGFFGNAAASGADFTAGPLPGGLPASYTRVKYIESTGTQYIDTKYKMLASDRVECVLDAAPFARQVSRYFPVAFGWKDGDSCSMSFQLWNTYKDPAMTVYAYGGESGNCTGAKFAFDEKMRVVCEGKTATYKRFDGGLQGSLKLGDATVQKNAEGPLYVFAERSGASGVLQPAVMRLYSLRVTTDGERDPVRDFIPCVNADGVAGLYDLYTEMFYENKASGAGFLVPPAEGELPSGFTRVESLASTAGFNDGGYVDSGYEPLGSDRFDCVIKVSTDQKGTATTASVYPNAFGWFDDVSNTAFVPTHNGLGGKADYIRGKDNNASDFRGAQFALGKKMHLVCQNELAQYAGVDGSSVGSITSTQTSFPDAWTHMYIFSGHDVRKNDPSKEDRKDQPYQTCVMRLYSFKIYGADNELKRDYVPCTDSNGAAGLYERVENHFCPANGVFRTFVNGGMMLLLK